MLSEPLYEIAKDLLTEEVLISSPSFSINLLFMNNAARVLSNKIKRAREEGLDTTKIEKIIPEIEKMLSIFRKSKKSFLDKKIENFNEIKGSVKKNIKDLDDVFSDILSIVYQNKKTFDEIKMDLDITVFVILINLMINKLDCFAYISYSKTSERFDKETEGFRGERKPFEKYKIALDDYSSKVKSLFGDFRERGDLNKNQINSLKSRLIAQSISSNLALKDFIGIGCQSTGATFSSSIRKNNNKKVQDFVYKMKTVKKQE